MTTMWYGKEVTFRIKRGMERNLTQAAIFLQGKVKESMSQGGPTATNPDAASSSPGEPPHVRTGRLRNSIAYEVDKLTARVGTNVKYAPYLEFGTSRIAARPYLRPGLYNNRKEIQKILNRGII